MWDTAACSQNGHQQKVQYVEGTGVFNPLLSSYSLNEGKKKKQAGIAREE